MESVFNKVIIFLFLYFEFCIESSNRIICWTAVIGSTVSRGSSSPAEGCEWGYN